MKFVTWLLIILGAMMISRMINARNAAPRRTAAQPGRAPSSSNSVESMVSCAHCGIYMPRSEALLIGKRTWCCEDHARLGPRSDRQS